MEKILSELQANTISVTKIDFDKKVLPKFANPPQYLIDNSKLVDVYVFTYISGSNKVSGFLVSPKEVKGKLPVIVFNRGGFKDFGAVKIGNMFADIAEMAKWGYVVIGSQYPGNIVSDGKDERGGRSDLQSILDLHKLTVKLSFVDKEKIGMYGASRGGMMTYLCLKEVNWIKAAVVVAGEADEFKLQKLRSEMIEVHKEAFDNTQEGLIARSAVRWTNKLPKNVPILLMHGTSDPRIDVTDSIDMANEFYKEKIPYRLIIFEGGDHSLIDFNDEKLSQTKNWFERFLKNDEMVPSLNVLPINTQTL